MDRGRRPGFFGESNFSSNYSQAAETEQTGETWQESALYSSELFPPGMAHHLKYMNGSDNGSCSTKSNAILVLLISSAELFHGTARFLAACRPPPASPTTLYPSAVVSIPFHY